MSTIATKPYTSRRQAFFGCGAHFSKDIRGSIGPLMGLMFVPVLGIALTAFDYNRADSVKGSMQAAIDAAASAGAQHLGDPSADVAAIVRGYLKANLPAAYRDHPYELSVATDQSNLSIRMADRVPTTLISMAGIKSIAIAAEAHAERPVVAALPELSPQNGGGPGTEDLRAVSKALGLDHTPSAQELHQAEIEARKIIEELERGGDLPPELERMLGQLR